MSIKGWLQKPDSFFKAGAQEYMKLICTASSKTSSASQAIHKCTLMHFINAKYFGDYLTVSKEIGSFTDL